VLTLDGKVARDRNDNIVEFSPHGLWHLLAADAVIAGGKKDERSKIFNHLMKPFRASGGADVNARPSSSVQGSKQEDSPIPLGLR